MATTDEQDHEREGERVPAHADSFLPRGPPSLNTRKWTLRSEFSGKSLPSSTSIGQHVGHSVSQRLRHFLIPTHANVSDFQMILRGLGRDRHVRAHHDSDRMEASIGFRIRVHPNESVDRNYLDARFFVEFTPQSSLYPFAPFQRSTRQSPQARRPSDEQPA